MLARLRYRFDRLIADGARGKLVVLVLLCTGLLLLGAADWHRRVIALRNRHHLTSVADFVSARYAKSPSVSALVTVVLGAFKQEHVTVQ